MLIAFFLFTLSIFQQPADTSAATYLNEKAHSILHETWDKMGYDKGLESIKNMNVTLEGSDRWLGQGHSLDEPVRTRYYWQEHIYDFENKRYYSLFRTRNDIELTHCSKVIVKKDASYYYNCLSKNYQALNTAQNPNFRDIILSRFPEPREYLSQAMKQSVSLLWEGQTLEGGQKMNVISFVNSDSTKWNLYIDSEAGVLKKVEGPIGTSLRSSRVPIQTRYYGKYHTINGVKIPYLRTELRPTKSPYESRFTTLKIVDIEINSSLEEQLFSQPENIISDNISGSSGWNHREVSKGVHFIEKIHSNLNTVFVEQDDYLIVFDAPIDTQLSEQVLKEIESICPDKPVRYVIASHFHYDHIGGLAAYVERGTTIIAPHQISGFIQKFIPGQKPKVMEVHNKEVLAEGANEIVVYEMGDNPHSKGMLYAYLPESKSVIVADLFWKEDTGHLRPARLQTKLFRQKLSEVEGKVEQLLPIHGPISTMDNLKKSISLTEWLEKAESFK